MAQRTLGRPPDPQYKFTGTGTDVPLMEWLEKYTFPAERGFQDLEAARHRYELLVKRFLSNGTTTAMYYGSLHLEPNLVLVDTIERLGQRAVVGKVRPARCEPAHAPLPSTSYDSHSVLGGGQILLNWPGAYGGACLTAATERPRGFPLAWRAPRRSTWTATRQTATWRRLKRASAMPRPLSSTRWGRSATACSRASRRASSPRARPTS
jgi:hypothetical protein